jgi:hypothetical protein
VGDEYYLNPRIEFMAAGMGRGAIVGGPIRREGYYVFACCDPLCCRPYGPFASPGEALEWSRQVMALHDMPEDDPVYARAQRDALMGQTGRGARHGRFRRRSLTMARFRRWGSGRSAPARRRGLVRRPGI